MTNKKLERNACAGGTQTCLDIPMLKQPYRCDAWAQNLDFTPTITAMVGLCRDDFHGYDLWPVAMGQAGPPRQYVTTGWGHVTVHPLFRHPVRPEQIPRMLAEPTDAEEWQKDFR